MMLQVPLKAGRKAYSFCSERLLAIETCPPVLIVCSGGIKAVAVKPLEPPSSVESVRSGASIVYEVVESDQRVVEQEDEHSKLKAKTDSNDPNHGVSRSYYIGEHRVGVITMSHDGILVVDVNIPAELRRRRYYKRILADSLNFFSEQGHRVDAIRGQYGRSRDYPDGMSTNLTLFTDAYLNEQMTLEDAVLAAPGARNAYAQGFSEVVVIEMPTKGWNPVNDCPACIESLVVHCYKPERSGPKDRATQFHLERGQRHSVARQALHRLYLEQLDMVAQAGASASAREPVAGAPRRTLLNYVLPDHLYGRFKSLASLMIGSDKARKLSARVVAHLSCPAGEAVHREADNGSDYTMIAMLGNDSSKESALLELGDHRGERHTQAASLRRGDVVVFPSGLAYELRPLVKEVYELIVIEWWRHGRNFVEWRLTPLEFSDPLLALANRQLGHRRGA